MSVAPFNCPNCNLPCEFEEVKPWPQGKQNGFGVDWRCTKCGEHHMDVCLLGPSVPGPNDCLNCGSPDLGAQITCPDCGLPAAHIDSYLGLSPLELRKPVGNAKVAFSKGFFRKGLALLNTALRDDRQLTEAWEMKYDFLHRLGYIDVAKDMLLQALRKGASPLLYRHLSALYQELEAWDHAAEASRLFITESDAPMKEKAEELSNLGNIHFLLGDLETAEAAHAEATIMDPQSPGIHLNLADFFHQTDRPLQALEAATVGLSFAQEDALKGSLLELRAFLRSDLGDLEPALHDINTAIALGTGSERSFLLQGRIWAMLGNLPEARNAMLKVLYIDPENQYAQMAMAEIDTMLEDEA